MKFFGLHNPSRVAAQELRIARLELLQSDGALEHYKHHSAMLRERIRRLEALAAQPEGAQTKSMRRNGQVPPRRNPSQSPTDQVAEVNPIPQPRPMMWFGGR